MIDKARCDPRRLVYAEGEERQALQAAQQVSDEGIAYPLLVGRPGVIAQRIEQLGLRLSPVGTTRSLLSRSHFGTHDNPSALKMRAALERFHECAPDLIVEGEMNGETAVSEELRRTFFGESVLRGPANLLVMPNDDAGYGAW